MYAYIDETGNTGPNMFDKSQPYFMTAAFMTRCNFDKFKSEKIERICSEKNIDSLHANILGIRSLNEIVLDIYSLVREIKGRFGLVRAEKKYIVFTKLFDAVFDSGINRIVPWHVYNLKTLRFLFLYKFSLLVTHDDLETFWNKCLLEPVPEKSGAEYVQVLQRMLSKTHMIPDQRSKDIFVESLTWAIENYENMDFHTSEKRLRYSHVANVAVFPNVLQLIDLCSKKFKSSVKVITHDRQSQFQSTLEEWHETYSTTPSTKITLPDGELIQLGKVYGSKFRISSSDKSSGLQIVDLFLWLTKKHLDGKHLPDESSYVLRNLLNKCGYFEMSFQTLEKETASRIDDICNAEIPDDQMQKARELLEFEEKRRKKRVLPETQWVASVLLRAG